MKLLLFKLRICSFERENSCVGNELLRRLFDIEMNVIPVKFSFGGREPVNSLLYNCNEFKLVRRPSCEGREPLRLLRYNSTFVKDNIWPIFVGKLPTKLLYDIDNSFRQLRRPRCEGRYPARLL